jgi:Cu+-exporting ATPase
MAENIDEPVKDNVCGMIKPRNQMKAQTIYKGKTFYFCSEGDKQMFEAHPDAWISDEEKATLT